MLCNETQEKNNHQEQNNHQTVSIDSFFEEGPLKVKDVKEDFPVHNDFKCIIHQSLANNTCEKNDTLLPRAYYLTHIDTSSYPETSVKEHTPQFKRYKGVVKHAESAKTEDKNIFLKYTSILDPNELVSNKYGDLENNDANNEKQQQKKTDKLTCSHNTAYIDSVACHLTSKLTEHNVCPHFPLVYGIYNGVAEKHFVEFTEEYYDHRHNSHFTKGVEDKKWCMIPNVSDSDSDSEKSLFGENILCNKEHDFDHLLSMLKDEYGEQDEEDSLHDIMKQNKISIQTDDDDTDNETNNETNNLQPLETCESTETNTCHENEQSHVDNKDTEKDKTFENEMENEFNNELNNDSDNESHDSIFSNDSNNPILDINQLTELSIQDIDVLTLDPTKMDSPKNQDSPHKSTDSSNDLHILDQQENTLSHENMLENTEFFDALPVHEQHLKLRNGCDFMDFQSRYLQMSNVPVQIVAMEAFDVMFETVFKQDFLELQHYETLLTREIYLQDDLSSSSSMVRLCAFKWLYQTKNNTFERKWTALLCQVCMALVAIQYRYDMVHNDMHGQNIMLEETTQTHLHYQVENTFYKVPTYGYVIKLIDMGRTTYQIKNTLFMGDVFRNRGEAGEQYSYIHQYDGALDDPEKRKHLLLPNPCFDLTRLACSLLDEFYGGGEYYENDTEENTFQNASQDELIYQQYDTHMFRPPTQSPMFNMLCEWITDAEQLPVNRFENFDLYKQISRRMRRSLPIYQLKRPHFQVFQCVKDEQVDYYPLTSKQEFNNVNDYGLERPIYDSDNDVPETMKPS